MLRGVLTLPGCVVFGEGLGLVGEDLPSPT